MRRAIARLVPVALMILALAACGSTAQQAGRPLAAAEPGHDLIPQPHPAGVSIRVGSQPQGIQVLAPLGLVAVGVHSPAAIVLISTRTDRVLRRIRISGAPRHLELIGPRGPLLVPEESTDTLLELSLPSGKGRAFRTGQLPHDAGAADGRVFVADEHGHGLSEILPGGGVRPIGGFRQPGGVGSVDGRISVVDVGAFTVSLLDPLSGQVTGRLSAGRGPTHEVTGPNRIYVADTRGDQLIRYSARPFRRLDAVTVPGAPYGVAIDLRRRTLWVTETARNRVAELSLSGSRPRILRTFPTMVQPDTVAVDTRTGKVYVANEVSGSVEVIAP